MLICKLQEGNINGILRTKFFLHPFHTDLYYFSLSLFFFFTNTKNYFLLLLLFYCQMLSNKFFSNEK